MWYRLDPPHSRAAWPAQDGLATPSLALPFALCLALFLGLHAGIRLFASASAEPDEAEQLILSQHLSWGYNHQPPLYTWLVWTVFQLTGVSLAALTALKLALIGLTYWFLYRSARLLLRSERLSILASLSLLAIPFWSWESLGRFSHSVLLTCACSATLFAHLLWLRRQTAATALFLGLCWAAGLLSKYNFAIFLIALNAATLSVPVYRSRLRDWRLAIAFLFAAALVLPHGLWIADHWDAVSAYVSHRVGIRQSSPSYLWGVGLGITTLHLRLVIGLAPLLAVGLLLLPHGCMRSSKRNEPFEYQFLSRSLMISLSLLFGVVIFGGKTFDARWLVPLLLPLPIWYLCRLVHHEIPAYRWRAATGVFLALAGAVLIGRAATIDWGFSGTGIHRQRDLLYSQLNERCRDFLPHPPDLILARNFVVAGNCKLLFPTARVCSEFDFHPDLGCSSGQMPPAIWLVWAATDEEGPDAADCRFASAVLDRPITPDQLERRLVSVAAGRFDSKITRLGFALIPGPQGRAAITP
jgi:hypothetical protein